MTVVVENVTKGVKGNKAACSHSMGAALDRPFVFY